MKISIVVPVYGCRSALEEIYIRIKSTLEKIAKDDYEIILYY